MNLYTRQSRRQFIKGALATTGTLGLTIAFGQVGTSDDISQIDSDALKKLRAQLKGGLILPTDSGYEAARRVYVWNPDTRRRPALVARCAHADDVRYAIEFARRQTPSHIPMRLVVGRRPRPRPEHNGSPATRIRGIQAPTEGRVSRFSCPKIAGGGQA